MFEIIAKLSAPMKSSIFPILLLTAFHKSEKKTDMNVSKSDFSNDQVPGENFPYMAGLRIK